MIEGDMFRKFWILIGLFAFVSIAQAEKKKVVSLAPNLTEWVYALGAEAQLVGNTPQCDWPEAAQKIPKMGDYVAPNVEAILNSGAKVVLATLGNSRPALEQLKKAGLEVLETNPSHVRELPPLIRQLGRVLDAQAQAEKWAKNIEQVLDKAEHKKKNRGSFLFVLQFQPIYSFSDETWMGSLFQMEGYHNILAKNPVKWPQVSAEVILATPPQRVFVASHVKNGEFSEKVKESLKKNAWESLKQATGKEWKGEVIVLPPDIFVRPGPRILEAMKLLDELP